MTRSVSAGLASKRVGSGAEASATCDRLQVLNAPPPLPRHAVPAELTACLRGALRFVLTDKGGWWGFGRVVLTTQDASRYNLGPRGRCCVVNTKGPQVGKHSGKTHQQTDHFPCECERLEARRSQICHLSELGKKKRKRKKNWTKAKSPSPTVHRGPLITRQPSSTAYPRPV